MPIETDRRPERARDEIAYWSSQLSGLGPWYSLLIGGIGGTSLLMGSFISNVLSSSTQLSDNDVHAAIDLSLNVLKLLAMNGIFVAAGVGWRWSWYRQETRPHWDLLRGRRTGLTKIERRMTEPHSLGQKISFLIGDNYERNMDWTLKIATSGCLLLIWYKLGFGLAEALKASK